MAMTETDTWGNHEFEDASSEYSGVSAFSSIKPRKRSPPKARASTTKSLPSANAEVLKQAASSSNKLSDSANDNSPLTPY